MLLYKTNAVLGFINSRSHFLYQWIRRTRAILIIICNYIFFNVLWFLFFKKKQQVFTLLSNVIKAKKNKCMWEITFSPFVVPYGTKYITIIVIWKSWKWFSLLLPQCSTKSQVLVGILSSMTSVLVKPTQSKKLALNA